MEDGKIYALNRSPNCIFAYCERGGYATSFYIGVTSTGDVYCSSIGCIRGMATNDPSTLANQEQRERFFNKLKDAGYHYNEENKAVFQNGIKLKIV